MKPHHGLTMRIFISFLIFWGLFLIASMSYAGEGIVHYVKGSTFIQRANGDEVKAIKGSKLHEGDWIFTGSNSIAIIKLPDGSSFKIDEKTKIHIEEVVDKLKGNKKKKNSLFFKFGNILIDVLKENKDKSFEVKTDKVALGVRGTRFLVASEESDIWAAVQSGEVEIVNLVKKDVESDILKRGQGIVVQNGSFTAPQKYKWVKRLNFSLAKRVVGATNFRKIKQQRLREFAKKRKIWRPKVDHKIDLEGKVKGDQRKIRKTLKKHQGKVERKRRGQRDRKILKHRKRDKIKRLKRQRRPTHPPGGGSNSSDGTTGSP